MGWWHLLIVVSGVLALYVGSRLAEPSKRVDPPRPSGRKTPSEAFRIDARELKSALEPDGAAIWSAKGTGEDVLAEQLAIARRVFTALRDIRIDAASKLLKSHDAWFDQGPKPTASQLADRMKVISVSVPEDVKDATVLAACAAFSGHVVEIAVARNGRVTYAGLLG